MPVNEYILRVGTLGAVAAVLRRRWQRWWWRRIKEHKATFSPPAATRASQFAGWPCVAKSRTLRAHAPAQFFSFMQRTMSSKPCACRNRPWFPGSVSAWGRIRGREARCGRAGGGIGSKLTRPYCFQCIQQRNERGVFTVQSASNKFSTSSVSSSPAGSRFR